MTIRRRLFWSNILMIAAPALLTALVGLLCVVMLCLVMGQGPGLGVEDSGELSLAGRAATEAVTAAMEAQGAERTQQLDQLSTLLDPSSMCLVVDSGGQTVYAYGQSQPEDSQLRQSAEGLDGHPVLISSGSRGIFFTRLTVDGQAVEICLFGTPGEHLSDSLRPIVALAVLLVLLAVIVSILLTNRFLTRFVFQKIEAPLGLLAEGARRIGAGDLDHQIVYQGQDEFAPVCAAFNEMAQRLKVSVERARRDEESRKELLAGISHDLRSPLTSIRAYVEGLLDGVAQTDEARRRYLRTIQTKAEDIDRLVSQLFLYSKLDLEGIPMEQIPLRLDRFVTDMLQQAQADYRERGLELGWDSLDPVTVAADPEQLRRAVVNILDNSAKYKQAPVGHVAVTVEGIEDFAVMTFADDGPGVPEDALPKLFDAFYRADPARKDPAEGSGLGLAIAAKAISDMGGTIRAYNMPTGGLAIAITLSKEVDQCAKDLDHRG